MNKLIKSKIIFSLVFLVIMLFYPSSLLAQDIGSVVRVNPSGFFSNTVDYRYNRQTANWEYSGPSNIGWDNVSEMGWWSGGSSKGIHRVTGTALSKMSEAEGLQLLGQLRSDEVVVTGLPEGFVAPPTTETTETAGSDQSSKPTAPTETSQTTVATPLKPPAIKMTIGNFSGWGESGGWTQSGNTVSISWLGDYISVLYQYGVGLAAVLAAVMIMVGGFIWLMSAGSPDKVGKAKDFIISALTGLFLALFSFMILATINPRLTKLEPLEVGLPDYVEAGNPYSTNYSGTIDEVLAQSTNDYGNTVANAFLRWFEGELRKKYPNANPVINNFNVFEHNDNGRYSYEFFLERNNEVDNFIRSLRYNEESEVYYMNEPGYGLFRFTGFRWTPRFETYMTFREVVDSNGNNTWGVVAETGKWIPPGIIDLIREI